MNSFACFSCLHFAGKMSALASNKVTKKSAAKELGKMKFELKRGEVKLFEHKTFPPVVA